MSATQNAPSVNNLGCGRPMPTATGRKLHARAMCVFLDPLADAATSKQQPQPPQPHPCPSRVASMMGEFASGMSNNSGLARMRGAGVRMALLASGVLAGVADALRDQTEAKKG